jgi:hypothetical protein
MGSVIMGTSKKGVFLSSLLGKQYSFETVL